MKVCLAGKSDIAIAILDTVLETRASADVVVLPNRTDTGEDGWQPSLIKAAHRRGLRIVRPEAVQDTGELLFLSLEYDRLIDPERFRSRRLYNIHFSLLPKYRGVYTSVWPILNGEIESGVTLHVIDAGIDTGDIVSQHRFPLDASDTARDLYMKYHAAGIELVRAHLPILMDGDPVATPQPAIGASYYSRSSLDFERITIDLRKTAWEIHNQIRAFVFREYQLPTVMGCAVTGSRILDARSRGRAGTVIEQTLGSITLRTVDFDLLVFKDVLPQVMALCDQGRAEELKRYLPHLRSADERDRSGRTPLMAAARAGSVEAVEMLVDRGASVRARDHQLVGVFGHARGAAREWLRERAGDER